MPKKTTLADVAERAGVSPSTVSRIINGTARVTQQTRQTVQEAIVALSYQPNVSAKGLVQGKTLTVGVVTHDLGCPYFGPALQGLQEALQGTEYMPIFLDAHWDKNLEERAIQRLLGRVDGLMVMGGLLGETRLQHIARQIPLIALGRSIPEFEHQCVQVDQYHSTRQLMDHLFSLGHQRIVHISGPQGHVDGRERLRAYQDAMLNEGLYADPGWIYTGDFQEATGLKAVQHWHEQHIQYTALFAANDQMALGARLALHELGIQVPHQVSLVGFDDTVAAAFAVPPLTTIRQPMHELGRRAGRALLQLMEGREVRLARVMPELMVRASTGPVHQQS